MKATLEIPDELYAMVKARAALEGRTLRSVAIELFGQWVNGGTVAQGHGGTEKTGVEEGKPGYAKDGAEAPGKHQGRKASAAHEGEEEDALQIHREHLRKIMQHPRAIDEIAGVLAGPAPDMDMAAMREIYEQRLAEEWKRRHT